MNHSELLNLAEASIARHPFAIKDSVDDRLMLSITEPASHNGYRVRLFGRRGPNAIIINGVRGKLTVYVSARRLRVFLRTKVNLDAAPALARKYFMSIDARIEAVTIIAPDHCETCDGTGKDPETNWDDCPSCHGASKDYPAVRIHLVAREPGGVAGQDVLTLVNPPTLDPDYLAGMIGTEIWGGSEYIMVGDTKWAKRIRYTRIELV